MSLQEDQVDLMNSETIIQFVQSAGPLGPLAYILVQILQTIIAPIPGNLVGTVGGFLFGVWGILWTTIGSAIGVLIVFILAKKYGRRIILKLLR
ncbi:TVP38/TMEM64 family protein, partial [Candidatus Saccharibacteria bacterium]|nr:TVP38/TMEM64 family protein [Candidatus Saccharibacteria bacterium]